ncbi:hypothetical protein [Heyndrickxia camelliae]|uniref:hypothetical protein n=1 Tax=Heyndrickxia camelliae TaxID=1707093 RepID=UPI0013FD6776|nr:hypothetical protein [Heyndrickxia camelliae]
MQDMPSMTPKIPEFGPEHVNQLPFTGTGGPSNVSFIIVLTEFLNDSLSKKLNIH